MENFEIGDLVINTGQNFIVKVKSIASNRESFKGVVVQRGESIYGEGKTIDSLGISYFTLWRTGTDSFIDKCIKALETLEKKLEYGKPV